MSGEWMVLATLTAALLGGAALAAERVAGWLGLPRRAAWAAAMLGSLLLPALSLWAPGLLPDLGILPVAAPPVPTAGTGALPAFAGGQAVPGGAVAGSAAWWTDPAVLLGLGWLAASLAMLCVIAWTYRRLRAACAQGVRVDLDGGEVLVTERVGPAVVGLLHPAVVVPRWVLDVPADERRLVLQHEREHVAAGDAWLLFAATLAVAAMPWCPALWWQHRRLRAVVEVDCDARVVARGADRRAYGRILIRTAGSTPGLPLLGPAWGDTPSQLERRIVAMTTKRPSHPLLRSLPVLALAAGIAAAACGVAGNADGGTRTAPAVATSRADRLPDAITTDTAPPGSADPSKLMQPTASVGWHLGPMPEGVADYRTAEYRPVAKLRVGSGAWRAGVREGDRVVSVDGRDGRLDGSVFLLHFREPGSRYTLRIRRGGVERDVVAGVDPLIPGAPIYH